MPRRVACFVCAKRTWVLAAPATAVQVTFLPGRDIRDKRNLKRNSLFFDRIGSIPPMARQLALLSLDQSDLGLTLPALEDDRDRQPETQLRAWTNHDYCKGRWLAPLDIIDELYDALLRLPAKGQNDCITLGSRDSDVEICCAANPKRFVKEPFAYTEAEAHTKLSAWREKSDLNRCDHDGDDKPKPHVGDPTGEKTASKPTQDSSEPPFATSEAEAVRCLRERGYIVAPPRASTSNLGSITPPPPYTRNLSSSQPVQSVAKCTDTPATSTNKRKRGDDGDDEDDRTTARATSCPSTPIRRFDNDNMAAQARDADGEPEIGDSDADADDDEVVSAPQRKKRKTTRTTKTSPPQKPTTPPRRMKTKKGTLTSTISYEALTELIGAASETVGTSTTDAENDADVSDGDEGERLTADEGGQIRDPPPTSSPEEIGALNLLSLRISAPTPQPAEPAASTRLEDIDPRSVSSAVASLGAAVGEETTGLASWSAGDRRLYRHFCEDVKTAEGQWDHSSTRHGMARLREREPLLQPTFMKCLVIARRTMSEDVVQEWRNFQEQGWEKRRQRGFGLERPQTLAPSSSLPAVEYDPKREVVAEAYQQFKEATGANTNNEKNGKVRASTHSQRTPATNEIEHRIEDEDDYQDEGLLHDIMIGDYENHDEYDDYQEDARIALVGRRIC
ncbi:hypothetical protein Q7P37_009922 [Cladosporium fusiforme]